MSHLTHEALWAWAAGEAGGEERARVQAHLELCGDCRAQLAQVQSAQALLAAQRQAEVPPLPDAAARRIAAVLGHAAEAHRAPAFEWPAWLTWRPVLLAAAAAALLAFFLWPRTAPSPQQQGPGPVVTPSPRALPPGDTTVVPIPQPAPPAAPQLAQVTSARKAKGGGQPLAKDQRLTQGSTVTTERSGALWLRLPDGSRAGLTASTEVTLARLEERRVELDVQRGDLVVVARHRPERALVVRAGAVEVQDVGTRFLVSSDAERVLVAVEEGEVEVRLPGQTLRLEAGGAVEVRGTQARRLPWQVTPPSGERPPPGARDAGAPAREPQTPDIPALPPPGPGPAAAPADGGVAAVPAPTPAPTPAAGSGDAGAGPAKVPAGAPDGGEAGEDDAAEGFSLRNLEKHLSKFGRDVQSVFAPPRDVQARQIDQLATGGHCEQALQRADAWLAVDAGTSPKEATSRVVILRAKLRCLTRLGRSAEADAVRRALGP